MYEAAFILPQRRALFNLESACPQQEHGVEKYRKKLVISHSHECCIIVIHIGAYSVQKDEYVWNCFYTIVYTLG